MAGKVVLINGASSGIGEHLAYEYARRGACLALVGRRENRLQEVAARAQMMGSPDVIVVPGDVSRVEDCMDFINTTAKHFGQLDQLVTNAGVTPMNMFVDIPDITKLATTMARKAALVSMYETLRIELAQQIGITIVTPGLVESEMTGGKFLNQQANWMLIKKCKT